MSEQNKNSETIQILNDRFRRSFMGGQVIMSEGISMMSLEDQGQILQAVREHRIFTPDDDPYEEHDFGSFRYQSEKIFWKIDYYAANSSYGSEDPANPAVTRRVLTVMKAREY